MTDHRDIDDISGVDTTGHSWDGIKELNNPLPRWWLWTFYATIIWAIGYAIAYPAWPMLSGATQGVLAWNSRADLAEDIKTADAAKSQFREKLATKSVAEILADPQLRTFATSAGASLFKVNCVQCHGSGAQGGVGYPNLNDDSWIWGGTPEQIERTIAHGVRDTSNSESRVSEMPAFGRDDLLTAEQTKQVVEYVLALGKLEHDAALSTPGAQVFTENCAACHGEKGEGNIEVGAPQLNDAIWLYGGTRDEVAKQVQAARHGMMPSWLPRLGATQVKELATYVHSLGGGQ
jgi:cytochrome c oxidase cbb3-type subunit III